MQLAEWFREPAGQRLLQEEAASLGRLARRFHGDTLLWAGCHELATDTVRGCMIRHRFYAAFGLEAAHPEDLATLCCDLPALPLPNNSVDAMVFHHGLEACGDPRGALREAARVLHPGGRLVICAFNPVSLAGLRRVYAGFVDDAFSGSHWVRSGRLLDWLAVLGFEIQGRVQYLSYSLPFKRSGGSGADGRTARLMRRYQPPFGSVYVLSALKQAIAVRPQWQPSRLAAAKLTPAGYSKAAVARATPGQVIPFPQWKSVDRSR